MAQDIISQVLETQDWLEPTADSLQKAVGSVYENAGEGGRKIKNFLHGTWLGDPLHPILTDIPIGAWTLALVMDALEEITGRREFASGADTAVAVGLVGAVAAALAGITDWQATDGRARKMGLLHGLLNTGGLLLYSTSYALRRKRSRAAGRGFSLLGFAVTIAAGYLGGKLVYAEQIGVDHTVGQELPREFTPVLEDRELAEGQLRRVEVKGTKILLARCNGAVYGLNEVCSHLGGPLAEGTLEDCSVRCPWHGSRFSLEDGRVLDGPAVHPQPSLETRITDGKTEVRSRN